MAAMWTCSKYLQTEQCHLHQGSGLTALQCFQGTMMAGFSKTLNFSGRILGRELFGEQDGFVATDCLSRTL